ncbi:MAG: GerMN domain-containing protein [Thermoleophilia bacterium]|nr:GerMN domain-containing protein [Thermoleophilia bacterium]
MRTSLIDLSKRALPAGLLILIVAALMIVATGCGVSSDVGDGGTVSTSTTEAVETTTTTTEAPEATTTTSSPETTETTQPSADTITLKVYFSKDEKICAASREVLKTQQVGATAMRALLEGPTAAEKTGGMVSNVPKGTTFLGLDIDDGIATVDLSKEYSSGGGSLSMFMRLAEVVFTLTQFPTVQGVNFKLDGEPIDVLGGEGIIIDHPMTRADFEDMSPAILVESPTLGNTVSSPLRVTGTANVFEAVFKIEVVNWDGLIIAEKVAHATSGTGTRGTFDETISFTVDRPGLGALIVSSESGKDGTPINVIEIPLQLEP